MSAFALDTLAPAIVQAQVNPLTEGNRLLEEGNALEAISEWSQALEKYGSTGSPVVASISSVTDVKDLV